MKVLARYYSKAKLDSKVTERLKFKSTRYCRQSRVPHREELSKKTRLPKNLSVEDDMIKLKHFLVHEINETVETVENFSLSQCTWLRSFVVARLALYNARGGEEGLRLLLEEWCDAMIFTWIPLETVEFVKDDEEKYRRGQLKLAYMAG